MEEKEKKPKPRGGFREGAGRKPKDGVGSVLVNVRLNKDHVAIIKQVFPSMTEFISMAVKEKLKREGLI